MTSNLAYISKLENFHYTPEYLQRPGYKRFIPTNRKVKTLRQLEQEEVKTKGIRVDIGEEIGEKIFNKMYNIGKLKQLNPITGRMEEVGLEDRNMNLMELMSKSFDMINSIKDKNDANVVLKIQEAIIQVLDELEKSGKTIEQAIGIRGDSLSKGIKKIHNMLKNYTSNENMKHIVDAHQLAYTLNRRINRLPQGTTLKTAVLGLLAAENLVDDQKEIQSDTGVIVNDKLEKYDRVFNHYFSIDNSPTRPLHPTKEEVIREITSRKPVFFKTIGDNRLLLTIPPLIMGGDMNREIEFLRYIKENYADIDAIKNEYKRVKKAFPESLSNTIGNYIRAVQQVKNRV